QALPPHYPHGARGRNRAPPDAVRFDRGRRGRTGKGRVAYLVRLPRRKRLPRTAACLNSPGKPPRVRAVPMRHLLLFIPALLVAPALPTGEPGPAKPTRFSLDNGLTVILRPVQGAKDTALVLLYPIGSDHDPEGRSGMAHFVEHLQCTAAAGEFPVRPFEEILNRYP